MQILLFNIDPISPSQWFKGYYLQKTLVENFYIAHNAHPLLSNYKILVGRFEDYDGDIHPCWTYRQIYNIKR